MSYLDIEEDFAPEVGFVPRTGIRRIKGDGRYRPRPDVGWIRQFSLGPLVHLPDRPGQHSSERRSRDPGLRQPRSRRTGLAGATAGATSFWKRAFEIREGQEIPPDTYEFDSWHFNFFPSSNRHFSGILSLERGGFFNGTRSGVSARTGLAPLRPPGARGGLRVQPHRPARRRLQHPPVRAGASCFPFPRKCSCAASCSGTAPASWWGGNFLFNYRFLPGSDLFVVYNQVWDTEGGLQQADRSLQVKVSWFWKR